MNTARKDWAQIKTNDSWAIFKIMSEFVEGYERMSKIGPRVSIFGSARTKPENKYFQIGQEFEAITLIQTKKINNRPIVLVGKSYWEGLIEWLKKAMLEYEQNISPDDLNLFILVDTADEAVQYIDDFYKSHQLTPNF